MPTFFRILRVPAPFRVASALLHLQREASNFAFSSVAFYIEFVNVLNLTHLQMCTSRKVILCALMFRINANKANNNNMEAEIFVVCDFTGS